MKNPFRVTATREVYRNPWIGVREDQYQLDDGTPGIYSVVEVIEGSAVLPVDDGGGVWLVREYKYAVGRASLECACGGLDAGESPLDAARRELREETGLEAEEWTPLGAVDPFTSAVRGPNHLFLARGLREAGRKPDAGEVIDIVRMSLDEAVERVMAGEVTHAASCVLILKAAMLIRQSAPS